MQSSSTKDFPHGGARYPRRVAAKRVMPSRPKPATKSKPVSKARSPAMKSQLKSKAKAASGRGATKAAKPQVRLQALLDAIRATPGDDELRLVCADALEECSELDRAELIRAQIAAMREPADAATVARAKALQAERDKAIATHASRWKSDRGLVWHVEARIEDWIAHGAAMFETDPITSIVVSDARDDTVDEDFDHVALVGQLAKQPWLAYVHAVEIPLYSTLGEPDVAIELLGSPHLRRMTQLQIGHPLTAIATAKHCAMPALQALLIHCEGSSEGDDALRAFAERRDALTRLELVGCGTSADGMRTIVKAGWKLERLVTAGTHYEVDDIGAAGLHAIAEAPALASLRDLEIETGGLDDEALRALAESPHLRMLKRLSLSGNRDITDDGIVMLAGSSVLASVRVLNLTSTGVTPRGIATLPDHVKVIAPHLPTE
jgi:uncharacterized protein (TIGR02996 family)